MRLFTIGDRVKITARKPGSEKYDGLTGEVTNYMDLRKYWVTFDGNEKRSWFFEEELKLIISEVNEWTA